MSDARSSNSLATRPPSIDTAAGSRDVLRRLAQGDEAVLPQVRRLFDRDEGRTLVAVYGDAYPQARRVLASARRLGVPALQINVARRQVNVAGPAT